jgi:SAM-dependent methyltransferase
MNFSDSTNHTSSSPAQPKRDGETPSDATETIAGYDQIAPEFAARWGDLRLDQELDAFAYHVSGQRRVLDLGCGPGRDVDFLTHLGCQVVGVDLSAGMLAEARRRLLDSSLVRGDLRHPPFAPGAFDGIWACASLLHLRRAEFPAALAEVSRLLRRPGGVFYLALKGGQGEQWVTGRGGRRTFFAYYQPAEVETALRQAGFEILDSWVNPDQAGRAEPWLNFLGRVATGK